MNITQTARRLAAATTIGLAAIALTGCSLITQALNGGESDVFTLKVGDCLNDGAESGDVSTVPIVDCKEPHDSEIFASIKMDDGDYPGESDAMSFADEECYSEFEDFIGLSYDESIYSYFTYYPTQQSWDVGDREVLCSVTNVDESGNTVKIEGSLEGVEE